MRGGCRERSSRRPGTCVSPSQWPVSSLLRLAMFFIFLSTASARAQSAMESHAKVQLIAEEKSVRLTGSSWIGILFRLDPGWHIYWQNQGDSGEPPKIEWQLPPGFHTGEIRWPRPLRLGTTSVRDYGYEGEVLLVTKIQPPPKFTTTSPVSIAANVKYLVCHEICIPGKADLTLSLPPNTKATAEPSEWLNLFRTTRTQLPNSLPSAWKVSAKSEGDHFVLSLEGAGAANWLIFFPLDRSVIENAAPQNLESHHGALRLTLKKSEQLTKPVSTLRGVIVLDPDRAYNIAVPVKSS